MRVQLLHFEDCPNWRTTRQRLSDTLAELPNPPQMELLEVTAPEHADEFGFRGSPTVLVGGHDIFESGGAGEESRGLTCRTCRTPDGPSGMPNLEQLRATLLG